MHVKPVFYLNYPWSSYCKEAQRKAVLCSSLCYCSVFSLQFQFLEVVFVVIRYTFTLFSFITLDFFFIVFFSFFHLLFTRCERRWNFHHLILRFMVLCAIWCFSFRNFMLRVLWYKFGKTNWIFSLWTFCYRSNDWNFVGGIMAYAWWNRNSIAEVFYCWIVEMWKRFIK